MDLISLWNIIAGMQILSAGAVFLLTLRAVIRRERQLNRSLSIACWIFAATSLLIGYSYLMEFFVSYYSANRFENDAVQLRVSSGHYVWLFWATLLFSIVLPQLLWPKYFHVRPVWPLVISGGSLLLSIF